MNAPPGWHFCHYFAPEFCHLDDWYDPVGWHHWQAIPFQHHWCHKLTTALPEVSNRLFKYFGFCQSRILHFFPLFVCPSMHRRDISIFSMYKGIYAIRIITGPIKPYICIRNPFFPGYLCIPDHNTPNQTTLPRNHLSIRLLHSSPPSMTSWPPWLPWP